jgi:hypothetical protein
VTLAVTVDAVSLTKRMEWEEPDPHALSTKIVALAPMTHRHRADLITR